MWTWLVIAGLAAIGEVLSYDLILAPVAVSGVVVALLAPVGFKSIRGDRGGVRGSLRASDHRQPRSDLLGGRRAERSCNSTDAHPCSAGERWRHQLVDRAQRRPEKGTIHGTADV